MNSLSFRIAWRFLKSSKGQTVLILLGITIGVAVQIFIGSLIDGLQISLIDNTIGRSSHITVVAEGREKDFLQDDTFIDSLRENGLIESVASSYSNSAFLINDDESWPLLVRGFELEDANKIYDFDDSLVEGKVPLTSEDVLIGSDLASEADLKIGDKFFVVTAEGDQKEFNISGIFDLQISSINKTWAITTLEASQSLFQQSGQLSAIEMQISQVFEADEIAIAIEPDLPEGVVVTNWKEENAALLSGLAGQSASSYMIQLFVLLAVLLGISSVLAISVVQKSRQLGILKAMGIKDKSASRIFLSQGLILGAFGSLLGAGLGLALSYIFSVFVKNPDGSALVPFYFDPVFVGLSIVIAITAATIAAFIPARKSSKLNPIEVIKNG